VAGNYDLGFGGQLNADELQRAIAAAGGQMDAPMVPPQAVPQQAPAPAPVAPQGILTPDVQAAAMQNVAGVTAPRGNYKQKMAALLDSDLQAQNQKMDLARRQGESASESHTRRAGMRTEQAEQQRGYNEQARADASEDRARGKEHQKEADELLKEMRANLTPPSASAGEKVWGVLGGLLAMGSHGRAAAGVNMISQLVGSDRKERWRWSRRAGRTCTAP
jgi:hypothetical protein